MITPHTIDALRFRLQFKEKNWETHPDIWMINVSQGNLRILDTKEGKETLLIIPDGPNIIEHYFGIIEKLRKYYRIVVVDLFGFGFSVHKGRYDYSFAQNNLMISELLDLLSVDRVNLIFPCANGLYGLAYTQAHAEKVKNLILIQFPSQGEMSKWADRTVPSYLKKPYLGQIAMPFIEKSLLTSGMTMPFQEM